MENFGHLLNMKIDTQIGRYLGVHIDGHNPRKSNLEALIDKISSRLSDLKLKCLSQAGRLTLIKSIVHADLVYKLSNIECPIGYANKIDRVCTRFFWGSYEEGHHNMHLVNADALRLPKNQGGLVLKHTKLMNKALLPRIYEDSFKTNTIWLVGGLGTDMVRVLLIYLLKAPTLVHLFGRAFRDVGILFWGFSNGELGMDHNDITSSRWELPWSGPKGIFSVADLLDRNSGS